MIPYKKHTYRCAIVEKKAIRDLAVSRKRESYGKIRFREYERRRFEIF